MDNKTPSNGGKTQRQQVNEIRNKKIIKLVLFIGVCLVGLVAILANTVDFSKVFHSEKENAKAAENCDKYHYFHVE